jgi:hypothetical protein
MSSRFTIAATYINECATARGTARLRFSALMLNAQAKL